MRLLALIEQASLIARILTHLGLPTDVPAAHPPRAPPLPFGTALCEAIRAVAGAKRMASERPITGDL
jgi:hypothetical protein